MEKNRIQEIIDFTLGDEKVQKEIMNSITKRVLEGLYVAAFENKHEILYKEGIKQVIKDGMYDVESIVSLLHSIKPEDSIKYGKENVIKVVKLLNNEITKYYNVAISNTFEYKEDLIAQINDIKITIKEKQMIDLLNKIFDK